MTLTRELYPNSLKSLSELAVVEHAFNPSIGKAEARDLCEFEFQPTQGFRVRPCLKTKIKTVKNMFQVFFFYQD